MRHVFRPREPTPRLRENKAWGDGGVRYRAHFWTLELSVDAGMTLCESRACWLPQDIRSLGLGRALCLPAELLQAARGDAACDKERAARRSGGFEAFSPSPTKKCLVARAAEDVR